MNRARGSARTDAGLASMAAATTWVALLAWSGFTEGAGRFLGPLLVLGAILAATGAMARRWRLPVPAVIGLQVVVSGAALSMMLTGSPVPVGSAYSELVDVFSGAMDTAGRYAAPAPATGQGVHPILIAGGLACMLLVDALACTLRRAPLAGLPLLMIYSIPISLLSGGVSWWVFALTAAGFLALLFMQEATEVESWGRLLDADLSVDRSASLDRGKGKVRAGAGLIGGVATCLAIVLPLLVPTLDLHAFDFGRGSGGNGDINIQNPMADLRRDLNRDVDVPLLRVTTDDPHPEYLRIAVLNRFSDNEWSSGDRDVPGTNQADGGMPVLRGVSPSVPRATYRYSVAVTPEFRSTWLPTQAPISNIVAPGDWRYDEATMDFLAGGDNTTARLNYSMTGVQLDLQAADLTRAPSSSGMVSKDFVELPTDLPALVRDLAQEVTRDAPSRFEKAVALQNWFRETGGFTYDLRSAPGNGTDDLVAFLTQGNGGRTGYCEQFAAAMAVMARTLGIPARVAVGFLEPRRVGAKTWEYSAYDLHAWPELFFAGAGWIRFEPTPSGRASGVPSYTNQALSPVDPSQGPAGNPRISDRPSAGARTEISPSDAAAASKASDSGSGFPWGAVLGGAGGALAAGLVLLLPRAVRRRRREERLHGGPEAAWAELRDTAVDLGVPWPEGRSPRETRDRLVAHFGAPVDRTTAERPAHGAAVAPGAVRCLDRLVRAVELLRYARTAEPSESLAEEVETCVAALEGGASRGARRRAEWWPRSVVSRSRGAARATGERPVQARYGGVVDHVG